MKPEDMTHEKRQQRNGLLDKTQEVCTLMVSAARSGDWPNALGALRQVVATLDLLYTDEVEAQQQPQQQAAAA